MDKIVNAKTYEEAVLGIVLMATAVAGAIPGEGTLVKAGGKLLAGELVTKGGGKIALGLSKHLDEFAAMTGGSTWKEWAARDPLNWRTAFNEVVGSSSNTVHFNLTGVDSAWAAVSRAARGAGGATDWELLQIHQTKDWWDRITFWNDGNVVPNPFK